MAGLVRYTYARCLISQHWMPPILFFALLVGFLYPSGLNTLGGSGAVGAILLVPFAAWLAIAAINSEDGSQRGITAATARGYRRARLGMLLAATTCGVLLAAFSLVIALVRDHQVWAPAAFASERVGETIALSALAHVAGVVFGVAFGGLVAKPVVRRAGFSWLAVAAVTVLALVVPGSPFRSVIAVLGGRPGSHDGADWLAIVTALVVACVLATGILFTGLALARRRE
jgi:hypothetical protein